MNSSTCPRCGAPYPSAPTMCRFYQFKDASKEELRSIAKILRDPDGDVSYITNANVSIQPSFRERKCDYCGVTSSV